MWGTKEVKLAKDFILLVTEAIRVHTYVQSAMEIQHHGTAMAQIKRKNQNQVQSPPQVDITWAFLPPLTQLV